MEKKVDAAAFLKETRADAVALYTSPLTRARKTAAPIGSALGLEARSCPMCVGHATPEEGRAGHEAQGERDLCDDECVSQAGWRPATRRCTLA